MKRLVRAVLLVFLQFPPVSAQVDSRLVGKWLGNVEGSATILQIEAGGRCGLEDDIGTCQAQDGILVLRSPETGTNRYSYKLQGGTLVVSGADLDQPIVFRRTGMGSAAGAAEVSQGAPAPVPGRHVQQKWGLSFAIPPNWKVADRQVLLLLGSDVEAGLMLIRFMRKSNEVALRQGYQEGLEEEGTRLAPATELTPFTAGGNRGLAGEMAGFAHNGEQLRARVIGVLTPFGDAAVVLGVTSSDKFAQLKPRVDVLAGSLEFTEPPRVAINEAISGQYMYYYSSNSGSVYSRQDVLSLCFNGEFTRGGETHSMGGAGVAGIAKQTGGQWSTDGDESEGVLTLTYHNGSVEQFRFQKSGLDIVLDGRKWGRFSDGTCAQRTPF